MSDIPPPFVCVGGIFIDDIVYPDGTTSMEILGGGGVHEAAGMTVWGERPGLVATLGTGTPEKALARMERDFDMQGVVSLNYPQMRAWQLFEWDGRRTEIYRVTEIEPFMREPVPAQLPESYKQAKAVAILRDANDYMLWKPAFPEAITFWEPEQAFMVAENADAFRKTLPHADITSPNLLEASQIYGEQDPHKLVDAMLKDGAKVVALRMGAEGSLVAREGERIHIPAVPVPKLVDQTGAGNTYCGGFLVGWQRTQDLRTAGYYGAVSASFSLEVVGVMDGFTEPTRDERYAGLMKQE